MRLPDVMIAEPSRAELDLRFRPRGAGRFGSAAFLGLWLCGWAVGETVALFFIGAGIYSLVTGAPMIGGEPARLGPALAAGCFFAVWLTIWTVGGVMAIRELLRSLWAEDRLVLDGESLTRVRRLGPFGFTRRMARAELRRVFVQQTGSRPWALMAQVGPGVVELTDLGTPAERDDAAGRLRAALGLTEESADAWPAALPEDWQVVTEARGEVVLVPNLPTRRKQALIVSALAIAVWTVAVLLAWESLREPNLWVVTAMAGAAALGLGRAALWLHRGRKEWRLEHGKLVHQRRYGPTVTELAESRALELTESSDSDGDRWYQIDAIALSPPPFAGHRAGKIPARLKITHSIHDPTGPRCLGRWLAERARMPFHDRVPTEADKQAEIARIKEQLAHSGKFGRFVVRLLDRVHRSRDQR